MTDIMYGLDHSFFTSDQQRALQAEYAENPKPSYRRRVELALEIGAKIHPVNSWFFYTLWTEVVIEGDKIPNVMQKSTADKMAQKNVGDFKCQRCSFSAKTKTPVLDHFRVKHLGNIFTRLYFKDTKFLLKSLTKTLRYAHNLP